MSRPYLYIDGTPNSLKDILEKNQYWDELNEKYPEYFEKYKDKLEMGLTCDLSELGENPEVYDILERECNLLISYSNKFKNYKPKLWDIGKAPIPNFPNCYLSDCGFTNSLDLKTSRGCKIKEIVDYCNLESEKINRSISTEKYEVLDQEEMRKIIQILYRLKLDPNFKDDVNLFAKNLDYSVNKLNNIIDLSSFMNSVKGEIKLDLKKTRNNLLDSLSFIYILSKYDGVCISNFDIFQEEIITSSRKLEDVKFQYDLDENELVYNQNLLNFIEQGLNNQNCRFLGINIVLVKEGQGHANLLLIDKVDKTIERFEPHGYGSSYFAYDSFFREDDPRYLDDINNQIEKYNKKFDSIIVSFLHYNGLPSDYTYFGTMESCPISGFQSLESYQKSIVGESRTDFDLNGYCLFWVYFYLEMRLRFPDFKRNELMEIIFQIFRFNKQTYYDFIRLYTQRLFLFSESIIKDCLQDRMTDLINLMKCIKQKIQ